jgi:hypothetical protein
MHTGKYVTETSGTFRPCLLPSLTGTFLGRRGNCKNVTLGLDCEVGLRRRTYNVLAGSVLSVWARVENVLAAKTGHNSKMQVVRLRTGEGVKIVGKYSDLYITTKGGSTSF